jgi:copper chaperone CopZ
MKTEEIIIANLKCSGCATTIKNNLMKLPGMQDVNVVNDEDKVIVSYDNLDRSAITEKLHSLGYPEATEENGLLLQLKSFASCMVGRVNNMTNK